MRDLHATLLLADAQTGRKGFPSQGFFVVSRLPSLTFFFALLLRSLTGSPDVVSAPPMLDFVEEVKMLGLEFLYPGKNRRDLWRLMPVYPV